MECFKVTLPEPSKLVGTTASGEHATIYPGEYMVHLFQPKAPVGCLPVLRFVGADMLGRDVHVPLGAREAQAAVTGVLRQMLGSAPAQRAGAGSGPASDGHPDGPPAH